MFQGLAEHFGLRGVTRFRSSTGHVFDGAVRLFRLGAADGKRKQVFWVSTEFPEPVQDCLCHAVSGRIEVQMGAIQANGPEATSQAAHLPVGGGPVGLNGCVGRRWACTIAPGDEVAHPARHPHQGPERAAARLVERAGVHREPRRMHPGTVLALVVRCARLHQHRIGGAGPDALLHPHQPVHPQVERRRHPDAPAGRRVVGHRRDGGGAPVPEVAHVPGEQHRVLVAGVDVERAVDGGVQVRGHLGESVAGVLVERAVHAHAVAPGDAVGVRVRAPGLDALGHTAAQRIAPNELFDGLGPNLQGEGVVDRKEVEIRDRVGDRRRHGIGQWVRRQGEGFGVRLRGHGLWRHRGCGCSGVNHVCVSEGRSGNGTAAPRHGEGDGSSRMRTSASIVLQSTSTIAAAPAGFHRTMAS